MKKRILFLIFLLIPFISAGTYGAGAYSTGDYNIGEVPPITPSGGSGSTGPTCTYDWQCTNWFPEECPRPKIQERLCVNKGTCTGTVGMPNQTRTCIYKGATEPLFDIFLTISKQYQKICSGQKIKANIELENYGKIELLDAFMTYWIVDSNNTLIAEVKDTRAVEDQIKFNAEIKIPEQTTPGTYRLYAQINYAENKTALAGESFEITQGTYCKLYSIAIKYVIIIILSIAILIITTILLTILIKKKKRSR
ncbi:MAG: hypothetical protein KJI69_06390, partial [Patescibacteria group bacterium]|nr:hypothetical protein [Patescibacteria group bacterium]